SCRRRWKASRRPPTAARTAVARAAAPRPTWSTPAMPRPAHDACAPPSPFRYCHAGMERCTTRHAGPRPRRRTDPPRMPPMPQPRLPLRLVLLAAAAIGAVLLLGFLVATLNSLLEFYQRIEALPAWLRLPLFALGALALAGLGW